MPASMLMVEGQSTVLVLEGLFLHYETASLFKQNCARAEAMTRSV